MTYPGSLLVAAVVAGIVAAAPARPVGAETLHEALAAAYNSNPTLLAQRAQLRATDELVPQALSGWRPTVSVSGELGQQRQKLNSLSASNQTPLTGQISVSQPLYSGGRTVAQTRSAVASVGAARAQLAGIEQSVLLDAVTIYMDVLRDEAVVQLNLNNEQVLKRQLEATRDRFRVGELTRTDVAQSEARLSRATADRVQAEGQLISSRASYRRTIGHLPVALDPPPPLPPLPKSEDDALSIAIDNNPTLVVAKFTEEAARAEIRRASGRLLPTVSLNASHTHSEETSSSVNESDTSKISAVVSVPLYQSGTVYSQVRQARETANQRRIEIEKERRAVAETVTQAWERLSTARARIVSRREEVRANEIALDGVKQEAEVGSRTTLDILDAEQELLDSRVALVQSERDEYVAAFALQAAVGRLTAAGLGLKVEAYDPTAHYREVRDKWTGTGNGLD